MLFMEVSAKTGENLNRAITDFLDVIIQDMVSIIYLKDVYIAFLLTKNDDFDDDLLQDAIEILNCS